MNAAECNGQPAGVEGDAMAAVAARLGVRGDFVRVPQLAKALGISSTSIHAQMRRGIFPMPHRKVGKVIVVKLSDYARWFESGAPLPSERKPTVGPQRSAMAEAKLEETPSVKAREAAAEKQARAAFKARLQREVDESLRRKGFKI